MDKFEVKKGNNKFYVGESNDNFLAHITYVYEKENVIAIDHTFVSPELRGKSIAAKLLDEVVKMAREEDLKVIPVCSYAVAKLTRNDEYEDILFRK
jgi:predicted GNAT family acetyltransferase